MSDRLKYINDLWDISKYKFTEEMQAAGEEMRDWLRGRNDEVSEYLFGITEDLPDDNSLRQVAKKILKQFAPLRRSSQCTYILSVIVNKGNEQGLYEICPPPISIYIKRDPSPFLKKNHPALRSVSNWFRCLWESLADTPLTNEDDSWQINVGQVLVSAALHGGLCNTSLLLAFYQKLTDPLEQIDDISFMTFELTWAKQPGSEFRRWFPDSLSEMLLLRLPASTISALKDRHSNQKAKKSDAEVCIKKFFQAKSPDKKMSPRSANQFVEAIKFKLQTRLPMFLVSYACRSFTNHSLKPTTWKRIYGKLEKKIQDEESTDRPSPAEFDDETTDDFLLPPWFAEIRGALKGTDLKQAKKETHRLLLDAASQGKSSPRILFSGWAKHMVHEGSSSGNPLALSTIRGYFSQIGQRILGHTARVDLATLPAEGFQEIYTQILEDAETKSLRIKLSKGLREFHHFMVRAYNIDPFKDGEVLGLGAALNPVDANLITPDEFKAILECPIINDLTIIRTQADHADLKTIARLVLILAFRCGMRRREILGLELRDLLEAEPCELLVRPHAHRPLKTKSSNRKLPLHALLPADELDELIRWKEKRVENSKKRPEPHFLFAIVEWRDQAVSPDRIMDILHAAIRTTTGDYSLKFHHLRHSFATWTLLRLMLTKLGPENPAEQKKYWGTFFGQLKETSKFLGEANNFLSSLLLPQGPTRKFLFADASLLGHAGPEMSLEHYVHCCDILLKMMLESKWINPERPSFVMASGLSSSAAHRHYKKGGLPCLLEKVRDMFPHRIEKCSVPRTEVLVDGNDLKYIEKSAEKNITELWNCLNDISNGVDQVHSTWLCQYSDEQISIMKDAMKLFEKTKIYSTKYMDESRAKEGPRKEWLPPPWPKRISEKNFFNTYATPVWELFNKNMELATWGVEYYLQRSWKEKHFLIFKDPQDAQSVREALQFLHFLEQINIPRSMLKFIRMDEDRGYKYFREWKRLLKLTSHDEIIFKSAPGKRCEAQKKWLGVAVKFKKYAAEKSSRGAEVFRFVMIMAFIDFKVKTNFLASGRATALPLNL